MSGMHIIRSLQRGFQVLEAINARNGSTISEISEATSLPRTTTFRLLENICHAGYAYRDAADERYRLTVDVQRLSAGFAEQAWISDIAMPLLAELSHDILWPMYIATLYGTSMIIRGTTSNKSPLAIDSLNPGTRVPLLTSASGKAYLAHCVELERETLINLMQTSADKEHRLSRNQAALEKDLAAIRKAGCAFDLQARMRRNPGKTSSFGVPIMQGTRVRGALVVRYTDVAMTPEKAQSRYFSKLNECAKSIVDRMEQFEGSY